MTDLEDDLSRWRQLSGFEASSSEEGTEESEAHKQHINRISVEGDTLYHILRNKRRLAIRHEAQKVSSYSLLNLPVLTPFASPESTASRFAGTKFSNLALRSFACCVC